MDQSFPQASPSSIWIPVLLFAVSAAAFTALWMLLPLTEFDGRVYMELARNIPRTGYEVFGEPDAKFLPLYPALMALGNWLTGFRLGPEVWGHIVCSISGAALTSLLFVLARRIGASQRSALAVAGLHLVTAFALKEYRDVSVLPLYTTLMAGAIWLLDRDNWFAAGLTLGLAAITRFEAYLLLPFIALVSIRRPDRIGRIALGFCLAAGYWWGRNLIFYDQPLETHYWEEVLYLKFHLLEIARDLLLYLSPVLILAAAFGFRALDRKRRLLIGGYGLLYLAIHLVWWCYEKRFLQPLLPVLAPPAALGLDRIGRRFGQSNFGRLASRPVLLSIAAVWMATASGVTLYQSATAPLHPLISAAIYLKDAPPDAAIIGDIPFFFNSYSRHQGYGWDYDEITKDPHRSIYKYYRYYGVRRLVWYNASPFDRIRLPFLDGRVIYQHDLKTAGGVYRMTYLFIRSFSDPPKIANIYEIKVEGPLTEAPAPGAPPVP